MKRRNIMSLLKKSGFIILFILLTAYLFNDLIMNKTTKLYDTLTLMNIVANVTIILINRRTVRLVDRRFERCDDLEKMIYQKFVNNVHIGNQLGLFFGTIGLITFILLLLPLPISMQTERLISAVTNASTFCCAITIMLSEMMDLGFRRAQRR